MQVLPTFDKAVIMTQAPFSEGDFARWDLFLGTLSKNKSNESIESLPEIEEVNDNNHEK